MRLSSCLHCRAEPHEMTFKNDPMNPFRNINDCCDFCEHEVLHG